MKVCVTRYYNGARSKLNSVKQDNNKRVAKYNNANNFVVYLIR